MNIATHEREMALYDNNYDVVIGIDEAGRGPLAGPVVASACVLKQHVRKSIMHRGSDAVAHDALWDFVRDSKKVSEKKRGEVVKFVRAYYFVGVGVASSELIDRMNILEATFFAMKIALSDLHCVMGITADSRSIVLVDGNLTIPHYSGEQMTVTKGDSTVKCIAAASLIAKYERDQKMHAYDAVFPQYGFGSHKGYGTKVHMAALSQYGATPIHRKSFAPVKKVLS